MSGPEPEEQVLERGDRERTVRRLFDCDTLTDVRGVVLREMVDAARDEASIPADDTDEG